MITPLTVILVRGGECGKLEVCYLYSRDLGIPGEATVPALEAKVAV
jgi:hypothetical protein